MRKGNVRLLSLAIAAMLALAGCSTPAGSGSIQVKGSDTMVNLGQKWAETFMAKNPGVQIAITGGGSGTGISALINRTTDVAQASRAMKDEEKADATKVGVTAQEIPVALDGLAVGVNPANQVGELDFKQLSDIFTGKVTDWKDVGGSAGKIVLLSRESNSGTHVFFLEHVLQYDKDTKKKYAASALLMPSSQAIVDELTQNPNAIGYFGMGYLSDKIKTVAVKKAATDKAMKPSIEDVQGGTYAISRELYVYTDGEPSGAIKAYVDFMLSPEGQDVVKQMDFVPLAK